MTVTHICLPFVIFLINISFAPLDLNSNSRSTDILNEMYKFYMQAKIIYTNCVVECTFLRNENYFLVFHYCGYYLLTERKLLVDCDRTENKSRKTERTQMRKISFLNIPGTIS